MKGRPAQPSKRPSCNKEPLCTASQVGLVQQGAALHSFPSGAGATRGSSAQFPHVALVQKRAALHSFPSGAGAKKAALHSLPNGPGATKAALHSLQSGPGVTKGCSVMGFCILLPRSHCYSSGVKMKGI